MHPDETDETFRVTDRRRRADADEPASPPPPRGETARPEPPRPAAPPPSPDPHGSPHPEGERSLAGLFVMLAGSAAMAMGDAADPLTGQVHEDLAQAADIVDLLLLLREKTEGNRSPEETQILDEILYDLQLRYVAATKRSGSRPGPARS